MVLRDLSDAAVCGGEDGDDFRERPGGNAGTAEPARHGDGP
jgi:hypothetical protein